MRYSKMEQLIEELSTGSGSSGSGLSPGLALEHFLEDGQQIPLDGTAKLVTPQVPGPCLVIAQVSFSGAVTEDDIRDSMIFSGIQIEGEDGMWTTGIYRPYNVTQDSSSLQFGSDMDTLTFLCPAGFQYGFGCSAPEGANVSANLDHVFEQSLISGVVES